MKKIIFLLLILIIASCSDKKNYPVAKKSLNAVYTSNLSTHSQPNDYMVGSDIHLMYLYLNNDNSFAETHENAQCFADLADFGGTYEIKDSVLTCYTHGCIFAYSKLGDTLSYAMGVSGDTISKYIIKGDTLLSLKDPKIKLVKEHKKNR
jgi:hypothetical protein